MNQRTLRRESLTSPDLTHDASCRLAVIEERLGSLVARPEFHGLVERVARMEERLNQTATKSWVLGVAVAMLTGTLGGFWWIIQQHLTPFLRAVAN